MSNLINFGGASSAGDHPYLPSDKFSWTGQQPIDDTFSAFDETYAGKESKWNLKAKRSSGNSSTDRIVRQAISKQTKFFSARLSPQELMTELVRMTRAGDSIELRIQLAIEIAGKGTQAASDLCRRLPELDLMTAPIDERLRLYHQLIRSGPYTARDLIRSIQHLGLADASPEQRLEFAEALAADEDWTASTLADHLFKIDLTEAPQQRVFQLCLTLAAKSQFPQRWIFLLPQFDMSEDQRFLVFQIALLRTSSPATLLSKLPSLQLCLDHRRETVDSLIKHSPERAALIGPHFRSLGLDELHVTQRMALFRRVLRTWDTSKTQVLCELPAFHLEEASIDDCLALCEEILSLGGSAAKDLALHPHALNIHLMDQTQRLHICQRIYEHKGRERLLRSGITEAFFDDIRNCDHVQQRLELCHHYITAAPWLLNTLCKESHTLGLKEANLDEVIELATALAHTGRNLSIHDLLDHLNVDQLINSRPIAQERLQICLDIIPRAESLGAYIASALPEFQLDEAGYLQVIDCILQNSSNNAEPLATCYQNLGLSPASCLNIAHTLAAASQQAASRVLVMADQLIDQGHAVHDLFPLYRLCIKQGYNTCRAFLANLGPLDVKELALEQRLELARLAVHERGAFQTADIKALHQLTQGASPGEHLGLHKAMIRLHPVNGLVLLRDAPNLLFWGLSLADSLDLALGLAKCPSSAYNDELAVVYRLITAQLPNGRAQALLELCQPSLNPNRFAVSRLYNEARSIGVSNPIAVMLGCDVKYRDHGIYDLVSLFRGTLPFDLSCKIMGEQCPRLRELLSKWAAYTAGVLEGMEPHCRELLLQSGVLELILNHRNPEQRYILVRQVANLDTEQLQVLCREERKQAKLSWILLARLTQLGFDPQWATECLVRVRSQRGFRDAPRLQEFLNFLLALMERAPLRSAHTHAAEQGLLAILTQAPDTTARAHSANVMSSLQTLRNISTLCGDEEMFRCLESGQRPKDYFSQHFAALFDLGDLPDVMERYDATLARFRDGKALFTYLSSVKKLPEPDREQATKALQLYVRSVLTGDFHATRYDPEQNPHLAKLFSLVPTLENDWRQSSQPQSVSAASRQEQSRISYREIFIDKILIDKHLQPQKDYTRLVNYLTFNNTGQPPQGDDPKEVFEDLMIQLCEHEISIETFREKYQTLNLDLGELHNDIQALFSKEAGDGLVISESDAPDDLLLIGTEIRGSCQRVNGTPRLNKCLLGYLLNGEIRAITVKKDGKLVARALLRLLLDPESHRPVILKERTYNNITSDPEIDSVIDRWAIAKAARMGLALVARRRGTSYPGTLHFYGGLSPFIYSDAVPGGIQSGSFSVNGLSYLYDPNSSHAASSS